MDTERIVVGKLGRPFGVGGQLHVVPTGHDPDRFAVGVVLFLEETGDKALTVSSRRVRQDRITAGFKEVADRTEAEALVGSILYQDINKMAPLPEGIFYHFQLVGMKVVKADGEELGEVVRVHEVPTHDVFEVRSGLSEWMIPKTDEFVASLDGEAGVIQLADRDDLLEAVHQVRETKDSPGTIRRKAREASRAKAREARDRKRAESEAKPERRRDSAK